MTTPDPTTPDPTITCYKCKEETDTPVWISDKYDKSGLCAACDLKARIREDLHREHEHPGDPFYVGSMTLHTDVGHKLICPYCEAVYDDQDFWEDKDLYNDNDGWSAFVCEHCEKDFEFSVKIEYRRKSRRIVTDEHVESEYGRRIKEQEPKNG